MKEKRKRTDDDYIRLDDAVATICDWREEILDALAKRGLGHRALSDTLAAMREVHSPDEGEQP